MMTFGSRLFSNIVLLTLLVDLSGAEINARRLQTCNVQNNVSTCSFGSEYTFGEQTVQLKANLTCPVTADMQFNQIPTAEEQKDSDCQCATELINVDDGQVMSDELGCSCFACPSGSTIPYAFSCEKEIAGVCKAFDCNVACNGDDGISTNDEDIPSNGGQCPVEENIEECERLLSDNKIPCRCAETDCISFSNGKFQDCVDGSNTIVTGSTATGCRILNHAPQDFQCDNGGTGGAEQSYCGPEPCIIPIPLPCKDFAESFNFEGTCCSLSSPPDAEGCQVTVAHEGTCLWLPKDNDCNKEEFGCNVIHTSGSVDDCPVSDFDVLAVDVDDNFESKICGTDPCIVVVPMPCDQMMEEFDFDGTCCSMKSLEDIGACEITVANMGECQWTPKSGACREQVSCDILHKTDSTDACPTSPFNPLAENPDEPQDPTNDQCADAVMLEAGVKVTGTIKYSSSDFTDANLCGLHSDFPGIWYSILGGGSNVTVHVCTNNEVITDFGIFGECDTNICISSPPAPSTISSCAGNSTNSLFFFADVDVVYNIHVRSELLTDGSNFEIWYEGSSTVTDITSLPKADTTIVREGFMVGDNFGSDDTILVQRYAADQEISSSYALLEFIVDFEEIGLLQPRSDSSLCLERLPRTDLETVNTYSICRLSVLPDEDLEAMTGETANYTMPDHCLRQAIVEFEIGPNTDDIVCVNVTSLLFDPITGEVSIERNARRQMLPLGTETLLLMVDSLKLSDVPGDRFYSRTGISEGRSPELVFIPKDDITSNPDSPPSSSPPGIEDCDTVDDSMTCRVGGTITLDGQLVLLDATLTCPLDAINEYGTFAQASQVQDTCTCSVMTKMDGDDFDFGCDCYACPEGSMLDYSYHCEMAIVNECFSFDCSGTCNNDENLHNNSTSTPVLNATEVPNPTSDPDQTLTPTMNATQSPEGDESLDESNACQLRVWVALAYIVLPMAVMRRWV
jgi:hypothetical protein